MTVLFSLEPELDADLRGEGDADGGAGTEEVAESAAGYDVRVVPGDSLNFKITRPEDLVMAERIFAEWGGQ